jgi:PAS domain S-box-containing protein
VDAAANILIVDDNRANLLALEAILEPLGHRLTKAGSGEQALKCLLTSDFAVILLDVRMAGLDGFATAALIKQRERSRHIPIIFLTAISTDTSHVFQGYASGAVDYLVKPFSPDILRSKVSVFVDLFLKGEQIKRQEATLRRLQLEAAARRSELRFRSLTDSMPQCVWAMRPDGEVYYSNRVWFEYAGVEPRQDVHHGFLDLAHPTERERLEALWQESLRTSNVFEAQYQLRRERDGAYRWHLGRAVPQYDENGAVWGWIATATDIDEQVLARNELEELTTALQRAVHARDEFLSMASHELRTPLTSLQLTVQGLIRTLERNSHALSHEVLAAKLGAADKQVRRQVKLVECLLDVSRIADGGLKLEPERLDLSQVAHDVAERFEEELCASGSVLTLRTDAVIGDWDRLRVDQVLTNLLSNAVKYGKGKPIELTVEADRERARVSVADRGIGIDPDDQPRLFQRFARAVPDERYSGLGLGLWISRRIVEASGGRILLSSAPGSGSTFTIELPLAAGAHV